MEKEFEEEMKVFLTGAAPELARAFLEKEEADKVNPLPYEPRLLKAA